MIVPVRSLYVFIYTCWGNVLRVDNILVISSLAHGAPLILNSLGWVNGNVSSRFNLLVDKGLMRVKLDPVLDHEEMEAEGHAPIEGGPKWAPQRWTAYVVAQRITFLILV